MAIIGRMSRFNFGLDWLDWCHYNEMFKELQLIINQDDLQSWVNSAYCQRKKNLENVKNLSFYICSSLELKIIQCFLGLTSKKKSKKVFLVFPLLF